MIRIFEFEYSIILFFLVSDFQYRIHTINKTYETNGTKIILHFVFNLRLFRRIYI